MLEHEDSVERELRDSDSSRRLGTSKDCEVESIMDWIDGLRVAILWEFEFKLYRR